MQAGRQAQAHARTNKHAQAHSRRPQTQQKNSQNFHSFFHVFKKKIMADRTKERKDALFCALS
jgi:hypothetical protein